MEPKTIVILGASILQLPAIKKAKEMGLSVIAVDRNKDSIGFNYADVSLVTSILDAPSILHLLEPYNVDGIMTLASDQPLNTVAVIAEELNIKAIDRKTAINVTNKGAMRDLLKENNIPIPKYYKIKTKKHFFEALKHFPKECIVKPVDSSGSRGIIKIENTKNKKEVEHAYKYSMENTKSGEIIVEEFMVGTEVSVEAITIDDKTNIVAITDKLTSGPPNFIEVGHSIPSKLSNTEKDKIVALTVAAIRALDITNSPSHVEVIFTDEGPKIVEIGARLGGDNISTHLVPLATGLDLVRVSIQMALGQTPEIHLPYHRSSAIRYIVPHKGKIKNIKGAEKIKKIEEVFEINLLKSKGDSVSDMKRSNDRIGYVITQAEDIKSAIKASERAINILEVDYEK